MKLKNAILYRIYDNRKALIIFYIAIVSILLLVYVPSMITNTKNHSSSGRVEGMEMASIIFLFVLGLNSFKESFRMFMQNGMSRRTILKSFLFSAVIISFSMAVIDRIINIVFRVLFASLGSINYISLFQRVPGIPSKGLLFFLSTILLSFFAYAAAMMLGYFITTMYYRMNKSLKLIVSIGVPGFLFMLLPIIDYSLFKGAIFSGMKRVLTFSFGNFLMIIVSCIVLYAVFAALSWLLVKKVVVKE